MIRTDPPLRWNVRGAFFLFAALLLTQSSFCPQSRPTPTPNPQVSCNDATPGPSVRTGSLDLNPTVGVLTPGMVAKRTLFVKMSGTPATYNLDAPGLGPDETVFEICIKTNPPAANTQLGAAVSGTLLDPVGAGGPSAYWERVFTTLFVNPLQDTRANAAGVVKLDVTADQMRSALLNAPAGFPSGRERIMIVIGPTYELELTLAKQ